MESGVIGGRWASDRKRMEGWGWERRGNEAEGETNETDRARRRERGKWRNGERKGYRARERGAGRGKVEEGRGKKKATGRPVRFWFDAVRFGS